jgi:hypothetical protein
MHILHEMGNTLDSDMHFEVGRSGDWSIERSMILSWGYTIP